MGESAEAVRTSECHECGASYAADAKFCAGCGTGVGGLDLDLDGDNSEALPAGTRVGAYRILELLGEGGMGRVYAAEHTKLGRQVAIKMLRAEYAANPVAVRRFFAEARAVNRISHENIVEVTDFLENPGGDNCYIMELLKGEDLALRMLREQILPLDRALDICIQIASALAAVHAAEIVHRDLKPDNVFLITRSGTTEFVKLLDFGVAKLSSANPDKARALDVTGVGTIIGTPEYMSPEQAGGQAVDHRTDIYALGVILYELVTGALPFQAASFGELVIKHMTVPPKVPSTFANLPHVIPPQLDDVIMELLAKDAGDRPQTMLIVEQRLREVRDSLGLPRPTRAPTSGQVPLPRMTYARAQSQREPTATPSEVRQAGLAPTIDRDHVEPLDDSDLVLDVPRRGRAGRYAAAFAAVCALAVAGWLVTRDRHDSHDAGPGVAAAAAVPAAPVAAPAAAPVAAPAPAPAPAPVPATTPAPPEIKIKFVSTPPGATVRVSDTGETLGVTPFVKAFARADRALALELVKDGYVTATETTTLDADNAIAVALAPAPQAAAPPAAVRKPTRPAPAKPKAATTRTSLDRGGTMNVFDDP